MSGPFRWKARYTVMSILVTTFLVSSMDKVAISVALPYIAKDLHLSPVVMGSVMSAFFLSYSIAQIPGGLLADKLGVRKVAAVAMIWWSTFTGLTGATTSIVQLMSSRFLFGLGEGLFPACAFKTIATWFPKRERATANSVMFAANFLGAAIAPLLVVAIISLWSWRQVFFVLFIPGMIVTLLFWRFIPNHPSGKAGITDAELAEILDDGENQAKQFGDRLIVVLLNPIVVKYFLIVFTFDLTYWGFASWLPTYLIQARGLSMVEMGVFASFPAFAGTIGCVIAGWMSDRFFSERRRMPIIVAELFAAVFLYLTFSATSTVTLVIFQTLSGFALMFFFGVFWALPMNSVPARNMGLTGSFINMAGQMAAVVAPMVIGFLVHLSGGRFGTTFAFLIASLLVSSGLVLTLPGKWDQRKEAALA
jgi:MFS family permease